MTAVSNWNTPFTFNRLFQASNLPYNTRFENDEFSYFELQNAMVPHAVASIFWVADNFTVSAATASINELKATDFAMYPNPAHGVIYVNSEHQNISGLSVVDIKGSDDSIF
jgi:hypothetical protein